MARKPRVQDASETPRIKTRLGKDTRLKGTLRFTESVEVSGSFEGTIEAEGFLFVVDGADVRADIRARDIIIGGTVHGNIEASHRLDVLSTGRIYGNIRTAQFRVADGVVFEGTCEMIRDADAIDVFAAPLDRVRETLSE